MGLPTSERHILIWKELHRSNTVAYFRTDGNHLLARFVAEVGPRLGRARTVGLDVSAMVPRTWPPQQMACAARHRRPSRCHCGRL